MQWIKIFMQKNKIKKSAVFKQAVISIAGCS
jgi:hypothetical protein